MKMSGPALMNRCLDGKKSADRHRIGAPTIGGKWVCMVALAVKSIGQSSGLKNSLKRRQNRAKLQRNTARGGKSVLK
jgi:hypothetical protein